MPKISQLDTAPIQPLVGNEPFVVVQNGVTVRAPVDQIPINLSYPTIAALQAASPPAAERSVYVEGYYSSGDGGGHWRTRGTGAGEITDAAGDTWIVDETVLMSKAFGVKSDGVTDDLARLLVFFEAVGDSGKQGLLCAGTTLSSGLLTCSGLAFYLAGDGDAVLRFTGATGGIRYTGDWANSSSQVREFVSLQNLTLVTTQSGLHTAVDLRFPYAGSSQYSNYDVNVKIEVSNVNDANVYWSQAVCVLNGWRGLVSLNGSQSIQKRAGTLLKLDGLSPATFIRDIVGHYWDKAIDLGYTTMTGLSGGITGVPAYGDIALGGTSGATGRVARGGSYGGSDVVLVEVTGTFQNGEIVSFAPSGASITLSSGPATIYQPGEGVYINNAELVHCNRGFFSDQQSTSVGRAVGVWINSFHANTYDDAIYARYTDQISIGTAILYAAEANWNGIDVANCAIVGAGPGLMMIGGGLGTTTGILAGAGAQRLSFVGSYLGDLTTALNINATCINSSFGELRLSNNTTNITNAGPTYPTANFNHFWGNNDFSGTGAFNVGEIVKRLNITGNNNRTMLNMLSSEATAPIQDLMIIDTTAPASTSLSYWNCTSSAGTVSEGRLRLDGALFVKAAYVGDDKGSLGTGTTFTNAADVSANSTGVGTILFKGATSRNSAGFLKLYHNGTTYYVPVFTAITG